MPRYHFIRMARTCHVTFLFIWWKCLLKMSELHPVLRWGLAAMQYRAVSFWEDIFTNKCGPILTYKTELGFLTFSWELSIYYPKLILKQWFLYNKNERLEYNCLYGWKQNRTKHHTRFFFFFFNLWNISWSNLFPFCLRLPETVSASAVHKSSIAQSHFARSIFFFMAVCSHVE